MHPIDESQHRARAWKDLTGRSWWQGCTRLRLPLRHFVWLVLSLGVAVCLLSGCGPRREAPFAETPQPDIAVTTLTVDDIETVARMIQIQRTIRRGCDISSLHPLPERLQSLVQHISEQHRWRARDLDALILLKNAPTVHDSPKQHELWLEPFTRATSGDWIETVAAFHRTTQLDALRLFRDAADRSPDPDVQAFARRQVPGFASTLTHLEQWADDVH